MAWSAKHWSVQALALFSIASVLALTPIVLCQDYGLPDRGAPGDEMVQAYLGREAAKLHQGFLQDIHSAEDWRRRRPAYRQEYFYMLGLSPLPKESALEATVTGTLAGDGYVVEMLHYQSRPGLYVTANLYRPDAGPADERRPAVLYVCGHSPRGRNGNKTAYQSHGIWFARHGYVCLMLDTLQLGEIEALHHGTYREGRWWWHSRGYTPAGVECLNGLRGIDYLVGRDDVDAERIAVTGISGGGAATFWIAAADERVAVAVPVSGMADLPSYVTNRVINGHCDCMFLYNTFQWPWTRIAALLAPRPCLFVNSDADRIFPMDANLRVIDRLERTYSLFGASDLVDSVVSMGGHAYRQDIRQAAYRFINTHLKNDPRAVRDSEIDLVTRANDSRHHPIEPSRLRVFPEDADIPSDELNSTIDRHFLPMASVTPPVQGEYAAWKAALQRELRRVTFRCFPARIPPARGLQGNENGSERLETEPGIEINLRHITLDLSPSQSQRVLMVIPDSLAADMPPDWLRRAFTPGDTVYLCTPRGLGMSRWTTKNPPNYVERSHALLGRTVDTGRIWDIIAAARFLKEKHGGYTPVYLLGQGPAGVLAAYAALWEHDIAGVTMHMPPLSHMDEGAPQLLNVLRVCDIPDVLGMLAPRPLTIQGRHSKNLDKVTTIYNAAGASAALGRE